MVVGTAQIKFRLFDVRSLKQKRKIVKSMIHRIGNRFNITIAETGLNDSHDWAQIGLAMVGNDPRKINSKLDKAINMADDMGLAMIADSQIDIFHM
jgi:uncharacterized protein YlxP (DUF503 family)